MITESLRGYGMYVNGESTGVWYVRGYGMYGGMVCISTFFLTGQSFKMFLLLFHAVCLFLVY